MNLASIEIRKVRCLYILYESIVYVFVLGGQKDLPVRNPTALRPVIRVIYTSNSLVAVINGYTRVKFIKCCTCIE